jgi:3-hydroxyacyl-[acyl-carrier-protein] dehydratase
VTVDTRGSHGSRVLEAESLLALIPQQPPFRFVDEIAEVDDEHIVGSYRFRHDEYFYEGHFPGNPITPGVILLETSAQIGVLPLYFYLAARTPAMDERNLIVMFAEAQVDFAKIVRPGDRVTVVGRKIFFRKAKLKVAVEMRSDDGQLVCAGNLAGYGTRVV